MEHISGELSLVTGSRWVVILRALFNRNMDVLAVRRCVYQIKVHYAKNLPKADTFGKIDAYVQFCYPHDPIWSGTKVIDENYHPIFNEKLKAVISFQGDIKARVMDKDPLTDEQVATFVIRITSLFEFNLSAFSAIPCTKKEFELQLDPDFTKKGSVNAKPVVCLSVGCIKSKLSLQNILQIPPSPHFNPSTETGSIIIPLKDHPIDGLVLVLEYEMGSFDIKLWETKQHQGMFIGLKFDTSKNLKYRMRRQTFPSPQQMKGYEVHAETKLDDIPLYKSLDKLVIFVADEALQTIASSIVSGRGWSGCLNYSQAKQLLKNVYCDDKDTCIYMPVGRGIFRVDWDDSNVDIEYMGQEEAYQSGFVFDIKHVSKHKRTINFFSKSKVAGNTKAIVAASLDDLNGVSFADVTVMEYKLSTTIPAFPISKFIPLL